ncbi:MAG TPA: VWA domain-containing protein [Candidatus Polarisedimenticolia bacterium]|jgi:Ca-activated chloride channel family protein
MIRIASPWLLLGLLALPAVIARYWLAARRSKGSVRFSEVRLLRGIAASAATRARHVPFALRVVALALLLLAFARPQTGSAKEEILTRGIDIVVALDNSTSMMAEDLKPNNRLAVAKDAVSRFIAGRRNDRIGLVVFAGRAYTRCPLTLDYDILKELLAGVDFAQLDEGTAIGTGLSSAITRLHQSDAKSRVIILLTDGRNNRGEIDPTTAAAVAQSLGIKIHTIGVGTKGEAPYPVQDPFMGKRYLYLRADIDEETLTTVADLTGGRYFRATDADSLSAILKQIDEMEKTDIKVTHYVRYEDLFGWLLWPGLAALAAELTLAGTRLRRIP